MNNILPKKALRSLNTYRPAVAEKKTKDVVRLSVNEGALGPSPNAIKAIKEWSLENHLFHRYPDQIDQGLINAIALYFGMQYYPDTYTIGYLLFPCSIIAFMLGCIFSVNRITGLSN